MKISVDHYEKRHNHGDSSVQTRTRRPSHTGNDSQRQLRGSAVQTGRRGRI